LQVQVVAGAVELGATFGKECINLTRMRTFRFCALSFGCAFPLLGACGGEPAKAPTVDLLAVAPPSSVVGGTNVAAAASVPSMYFALKVAQPESLERVAHTWTPTPRGEDADVVRQLLRSKLKGVPGDAIGRDRPMMFFLLEGADGREDEVYGVTIARHEALAGQLQTPKTLANGVLEVESRDVVMDDDDDSFVEPTVRRAIQKAAPVDAAAEDKQSVCWIGQGSPGTPEIALCGKRRALRVMFDYAAQVYAPQPIPADLRLDIFGKPFVKLAVSAAQDSSVKRGLGRLSGEFATWANDQVVQLGIAVGEFEHLTVDAKLDATAANVEVALETNNRVSWLGRAIARSGAIESGAPSTAGVPAEFLRMPADASEFYYSRRSNESFSLFTELLLPGLKAFGGSGWSPSDLARLEAIKANMLRNNAYEGVFASGIDLDRLPATPARAATPVVVASGPRPTPKATPPAARPKFLPPTTVIAQRPPMPPAPSLPTYQVSYSSMPFADSRQFVADFDALLGSPTALATLKTAIATQFGASLNVAASAVPRISLRSPSKPIAGLPADAVAYDFSLGDSEFMRKVATSANPIAGVVVMAPLGSGTISVFSPYADVAVAKLLMVLAGGAGTVGSAPNSTALITTARSLRGGVGVLLTPRTFARFFLADEYKPNQPDRVAVLRTPQAFVPLAFESVAGGTPRNPAGGRIVVRGRLPREFVTTGTDWVMRDLFP
jgi:hypothetical protein